MKVTCAQLDLSKAVSLVSRIISNRNTLPILNNILLEAKENKLIITSTNLELALIKEIPARVIEDGAITIPSKLFTPFVTLLPNSDIELTSTQDHTLHIISKTSKTKIKGLSADEYPSIPHIEETNSFSIPSAACYAALNQTITASAHDDTHPVLASVLFDIKKDFLGVVATDSYRLVEYKISTPNQLEQRIIIPSRAISELYKSMDADSDDVRVTTSHNQIIFTTNGTKLISRVIEGKYPPYEQIIPKSFSTRVTISTEEFLNTLRRASLFAQEGSHSIKLQIQENSVVIVADTEQLGSEETSITAKVEGDAKEIAFNSLYLIEALSKIDTDEVYLEITTESSPGVLRPALGTPGKGEYIHVIMPLKL